MKNPAMRVLLADDDTLIRINLGELLRASGYEVTEAGDGDVVPALAAAENPSVIILDIDMPRADGFDTLRALRSDPATEHIPVLMLSAINDYDIGASYNTDAIAARTGVRAPEAFLEKPCESRTLLGRLSAACA